MSMSPYPANPFRKLYAIIYIIYMEKESMLK
eukprot:COSAG02_NODE_63154_length_264_cov_0.606061_1_plen_30_part_10